MNSEFFSSHERVFFEGGLGSQLLALIEYQAKNKIFGRSVFADTSYFHTSQQKKGSLNLKRPWRITAYGYPIDYFLRENAQVSTFASTKSSRVTVKEHAQFLLENHVFSTFNPNEITFPYNYLGNRVKTLISQQEQFGAIHLRRGDFRQVASHLVSLTEVIDKIRELKDILPPLSFLFTDSKFNLVNRARIKALFKGLRKELQIVDDHRFNDIEVHSIMRKSCFLIAGNSTFSFSAALLNGQPNAKIYVPKVFNSDEASAMNTVYASVTKFSVY